MSTYVLIHGAWHGGWCWDKVVPLLEKAGHKVQAPDLPSHGKDKTSYRTVSLQAYADSVCGILDTQSDRVVLVGHSMGGIVISQAAEYRPEKVDTLVYLTAFLLRIKVTQQSKMRPSRTSSTVIVPMRTWCEPSPCSFLKGRLPWPYR
jgi:pimeloyl-ACP methyl ester carboxylesterase